jgi:competence protein ComGC
MFTGRIRRGFTLVDVLVSLGVVVLLIGIMLPGLGKVQEVSRQIVCRSNLRQVGFGLALYADSSKDQLPSSVFIDLGQQKDNEVEYSPEDMMTLRLPRNLSRRTNTSWDGLGLLYEQEMLPSQEVFYCPSHHGNYEFSDVAETWRPPVGEIVGNYHYRGKGPNGSTRLSFIEPSRSAIAADGLRTILDYNHKVGLNVLRADLSLFWLSDPLGRIGDYVEMAGEDSFNTYDFDMIWDKFDTPTETILPRR